MDQHPAAKRNLKQPGDKAESARNRDDGQSQLICGARLDPTCHGVTGAGESQYQRRERSNGCLIKSRIDALKKRFWRRELPVSQYSIKQCSRTAAPIGGAHRTLQCLAPNAETAALVAENMSPAACAC
jgi:hypothetical protein